MGNNSKNIQQLNILLFEQVLDVKKDMERFNQAGRRALDQNNEAGVPQETLSVSNTPV